MTQTQEEGTKLRRKVALTVLLLLMVAGFAAAEEFSITIDPLNPEHQAIVEPLFGTPFYLGPDPDGEVVYMMGDQVASVPSDTYELRHVILNTQDLSEVSFQLESRGWATGSGNPSLFIIFGWQDHKNYYYTYPAESVETRVARVVDGKHQTLYRHGEFIWWRNREQYQTVRVDVKEVDGSTVVDTYVNGELKMSYTFEPGQEPPAGKVGIAMWNNAAHNAYFKNITLSGH